MRKLMIFALSFSAAVYLAVYLLPEGWYLPGAGICALLAAAGFFVKKQMRRPVLLACLGLCLGFLWTFGFFALAAAPAEALAGKAGPCSALVLGYPQKTSYGVSVLVEVESGGSFFKPKAMLYADGTYETLRPGDRLAFTARYQSAGRVRDESVTYYTSKGVFLRINPEGELTVSSPGTPGPRHWPVLFSYKLCEAIGRVFPPEVSGFLQALAVGNLTGLTDSFSSALARTGLSHTISVSGMHLTFLVGVLLLLSGRGRRTALLGIPAILFFMAAVGNTPSVVRAGVMQILLLIAPLFRRETDWPTSLSFSLLLLLLANPYAAANVSLQLSYASMLGILLLSGRIYEGLARALPDRLLKGSAVLRVPTRFILATLSSSVGAVVFTAPLVALYFGSVSLLAPLANLFTLWAISLVFVGGLCAGVAGLIWLPLGQWIALPVSLPALYLVRVIPQLGNLPFAAVYTVHFYTRAFLIFAYALGGLCLFWPQKKKRVLLPVCAGVCGLCVSLLLNHLSLNSSPLTASVLDVGQGESLVLLSGGGAAIVDCGGSQPANAGDIAADYLQGMGISRVELLAFTHFHNDHADGAAELFARLDIRRVAIPDIDEESAMRSEILSLAKMEGAEIFYIREDRVFSLGAARLQVFAPLGGGGGNEEGLSVLCSVGAFDLLLTGDMNETVEERLVEHTPLPDIEVLIAGHHGSKYASGETLLRTVLPEAAIISVGYNSYGHPAAETLRRLEAAGAAIYRTDTMGMVTVKVGG